MLIEVFRQTTSKKKLHISLRLIEEFSCISAQAASSMSFSPAINNILDALTFTKI